MAVASADSPPHPSPRGHVLLAPGRFRGALSAAEVAAHLAAGLRRVRPDVPLVELPVADGGDGTVDAAVAAGWRRVEVEVCGPTGRPVTARLALRGQSAVVELAEASGLRRLPGGRPRPLVASSVGTGQLLGHAVRLGARRIVLGLGGGACTDGGAGLVQGLGGRLLDALGKDLPPGGAALRSLHALDLRGLPDLSSVEVVVAGEAAGPLLGRGGAAAVGGPRRGASRDEVALLDAGLRRWADLAEAASRRASRDLPGAGASGGVGFAALAFLGARIEPGASLMLDLLGFAEKARGAHLVVTGEGSLDSRSLRGAAPMGVARAAARAGAPVVAVAGQRALTGERLRRARIQAVYALADIEPDEERRVRRSGALLEQLTVAIADEWLPPSGLPPVRPSVPPPAPPSEP
ncbi:glycerate kinase [Actinomadura sp. NEAU-AAG7]|uniref:glycerate kinase n=1 Tax=Actinomadura sp. NEAU-AAG7 TaxID=2839640 RepID=UPI001BE44186|nr:glycerate kinase [Actinomadura sp. NEAU-AAG7]MBT2209561.1 glycerate kinase [Actinomadura sp. NEAU-AAG7]